MIRHLASLAHRMHSHVTPHLVGDVFPRPKKKPCEWRCLRPPSKKTRFRIDVCDHVVREAHRKVEPSKINVWNSTVCGWRARLWSLAC